MCSTPSRSAFDDGALRLLGRAARGSMRDALSLTDQAIAYGGGRIDEATVRAMLGAVDRSHAAGLIDAIARRDGAAVLAGVDALRAAGLSASATLEEMAAVLQQAAIEQAVPGALDDGDDETVAARALAVQVPADELQLLYSMLVHGRAELSLMGDEYGALTMVLLRLFAFPAADRPAPSRPAPRPQALRAAAPATAARPVRAAAPAAPAPVHTAVPATSSPAGVVMVDAALADRYAEHIAELVELQAVGALTRELAMQAGLLAIDDAVEPAVWHLCVERESLRQAAQADKLASALSELTGRAIRIEFEAGVPSDSPAQREAAERDRRQRHAEQVIESDPAVRDLLAQFQGARIVPGSIKPI